MKGRLVITGVAAVLTIILLMTNPAVGADGPAERFNTTYGTEGADGINTIIPTGGGNYLLVGGTDGYPLNGSVRKVSPDGTQIWEETYGSPATASVFRNGIRTPDGGYVLVGFDGVIGDDVDSWAVKIDSSGVKQWESTFDTNPFDQFYDVTRIENGNYFAVGSTNPPEDDNNAQVVKISSDGTKIWDRVYWHETRDNPQDFFAIEQDPDGRYILAGQEYVDDEHWDAWVLEIDRDGDTSADETYGHSELDDWFFDVAIDEGQPYFVGVRNGVLNETANRYDFSDAWVQSTRSDETVRWSETVSVKDNHGVGALSQTGDKILIVGETNTVTNDSQDGFAAVIDTNGSKAWSRAVGGEQQDDLDAAVTTRDSYYLGGETASFDSDSADQWLVRLDRPGTDSSTGNNDNAISLTTDGETTIAPGGEASITFTISNTGSIGADSGRLQVSVPDPLSVSNISGDGQSGSDRAFDGPIPAGNEVSVTYTFAANANASLEPVSIGATATLSTQSSESSATTSVPIEIAESSSLPTAPGEPEFGDVLEVINAFNTNSQYGNTNVTPQFGDVLEVIQAFNAG